MSNASSSPSSAEVIDRIESLTQHILKSIHNSTPEHPLPPSIEAIPSFSHNPNSIPARTLTNLSTCRLFTSITLILSFVHALLIQGRTTSTREVYYFYATHFRSQKECDGCILDVAKLLGVGRVSLGLSASPKGWFCGIINIKRIIATASSMKTVTMDGTCTPSIQGIPITQEWTHHSNTTKAPPNNSENDDIHPSKDHSSPFQIFSQAKCILVIEKEGVYTRLSEDRFYEQYPCILVTGRGFPDLSTRAFVHALYTNLNIPVIGICDCNPFGVSVLQTYEKGGEKMGYDAILYTVPIFWLGIRPSDIMVLREDYHYPGKEKKSSYESNTMYLPHAVFQQMTQLDFKRVNKLISLEEEKDNKNRCERKLEELQLMKTNGYKVELEAFHWLGMDFLTNWLKRKLEILIPLR